jgi:hypothetical protein
MAVRCGIAAALLPRVTDTEAGSVADERDLVKSKQLYVRGLLLSSTAGTIHNVVSLTILTVIYTPYCS